jgi:hypothetical protein
MEVTLIHVKNEKMKKLEIDEVFWANVNYISLHSHYIEIKLKRGRPTNYLHDWYYKATEGMKSEERLEKFKYFDCAYRIPEEYDGLIDYLYNEANKRNLLKYPVYLTNM